LTKEKEEVNESFNKLCLSLSHYLAVKYENSHFAVFKDTIDEFIRLKPNEALKWFIEFIYDNDEVREKIKAGDEDFFMGQEYNENEFQVPAKKIFEFKNLWKSFDDKTKNIVKSTVKNMVVRVDYYCILNGQLSDAKKALQRIS